MSFPIEKLQNVTQIACGKLQFWNSAGRMLKSIQCPHSKCKASVVGWGKQTPRVYDIVSLLVTVLSVNYSVEFWVARSLSLKHLKISRNLPTIKRAIIRIFSPDQCCGWINCDPPPTSLRGWLLLFILSNIFLAKYTRLLTQERVVFEYATQT